MTILNRYSKKDERSACLVRYIRIVNEFNAEILAVGKKAELLMRRAEHYSSMASLGKRSMTAKAHMAVMEYQLYQAYLDKLRKALDDMRVKVRSYLVRVFRTKDSVEQALALIFDDPKDPDVVTDKKKEKRLFDWYYNLSRH